MGTPHKHADVIHAWAEGEEIEVRWEDEWTLIDKEISPVFNPEHEYRIKPKRVKKEGWVNVYPDKYEDYEVRYHRTQYAADRHATPGRITCIRIEWEEEV